MSSAALAQDVKSAGPAKAKAGPSLLRVNKPGDSYELEADRIAEQVVSGDGRKASWSLSKLSTGANLQRECSCGGKCEECEKKKEQMLQRNALAGTAPAVAPAVVHDVLRGPGRSMDPSTRSFMESRFGYDFGGVRIYHDASAAASARAVSANAYTVGEKIVFNQGKYTPDSHSGRRLLAHELAHVVQQDGGSQGLIQRDEIEIVEAPPVQSNSILQQAFDAADSKHWEVAARLANGLSPSDMKVFLSQYKDPELRSYLHKGAIGVGIGDKSAIALATEDEYKAVKQKEEVRYRRELAKQNGTAPPKEDGSAADVAPSPRPLTVQEKKQKCESGETKGIMTFPLRMPHGMWRISVAPITATRSGKDILVSQPLNGVFGDPMFKREVKTLPLNTFLGGIHLAPDEIVRVRIYDDNERVICVTGEQMLKMSDASDTAVLLSIVGTALDAASVFAPGASTALVNRGMSAATAGLVVGATNIALNEGLEVARQESAVHYGLQDKVDWAQIAFETLLQAITLGFGGKLTDTAVEKVAGVAVGEYSRPALRIAVESVVQGSIAGLHATAMTIFNRLRDQKADITVGGFLEEVATAFAQGALLHAITSAASHQEQGVSGWKQTKDGLVPAGDHAAPTTTHVEANTNAAPQVKKAAAVNDGAQNPQAAVHEQTAPPKMEAENLKSPKALRKEDAIAKAPVNDPEATEQHEVIATKKGIARCSDSPCPAISIVYKEDLAANKEFAERYRKIRVLGETDVEAATKDAADLARDIEMSRRNKANIPKMGGDAPTDPDRNMSKAEWKAAESKRRWGNAVDKFGDTLDADASTSKVTGGPKSGYYIDDKKVPGKRRSHLDIDADPDGTDASVPTRPGETGRQAAARVGTVIGKKISDIPVLAKLWEDARTSILSRRTLTASNYADLYDATRNAFWSRVGGKTPEAIAARQILKDAGFSVVPGEGTAPRLDGADPKLKRAETTISLDHKEEKAIGDNWKKALDADNLQMEFAMPNTDRENRQARHPELRPDAKPVGTP